MPKPAPRELLEVWAPRFEMGEISGFEEVSPMETGVTLEVEAIVIAEILDPVDAKYRSASDVSSRKVAAVVPVLVVCANCVRISTGS